MIWCCDHKTKHPFSRCTLNGYVDDLSSTITVSSITISSSVTMVTVYCIQYHTLLLASIIIIILLSLLLSTASSKFYHGPRETGSIVQTLQFLSFFELYRFFWQQVLPSYHMRLAVSFKLFLFLYLNLFLSCIDSSGSKYYHPTT